MLRTQPENHNKATGPRIGLAMAGGGPLGMIYEIGALRALDEALDGIDFNNLHVYVGVSAGAVVACPLVNHFTTAQMCRVFIKNDPTEHPFNPQMFLMPAFREYWKRLKSIPSLFLDSIWQFVKNPFDLGLLESLTSLSQALPAGVFDNEAIHEYITQIFNVSGRTNDFRKLKQKLYIVAVDLDTGESVVFGSKGYDHVPISKAVQASAALPGLYPPVKIDDRYYVDGALIKTMHASVALSEGIDLLFCLNPLVPFDANLATQAGVSRHSTLMQGGMPVVLMQTFRAIIHSRMQVSMASYDTQYENTDVILFEPNRDDPKMFFTNVFSFSNRLWVCEHAYQTIRSDLLARHRELSEVLGRHGIRLRMDILEDKKRHFSTGLQEEADVQRTTDAVDSQADTTVSAEEIDAILESVESRPYSEHFR
ncbi:MAG: patatin-like phospholipase family protein [Candidatus Competibacteraceae bacterium]